MLTSIIARCLGLFLLVAAALKATGLGLEAVGRMGFFSLAEVQLAIIELEVLLGVWLISRVNPVGSWCAAVATFIAFAGTTFYLGLIGRTSCGCFGRYSPSPWYAFGLDVFILGLLTLGRPEFKLRSGVSRRAAAHTALTAAGSFGALIAIVSLVLALTWVGFGSVPAAIAYFRGDRVSVRPRLVEIGDGAPGEIRLGTVEVTNWTDETVRIFGGTSDCSCTVLGDLPVTIPAKQTRAVSVQINLNGKPGMFTRTVTLRVDDNGHRLVRFGLTGRILARPDPTDSPEGTEKALSTR